MNTDINNCQDNAHDIFRMMLMTLEYGGSVNIKFLEEIEKKVKESNNCTNNQSLTA